MWRAYPRDDDEDGQCDPDYGGCSYAHDKDSESCDAIRDTVGMFSKDKRGTVGGFLDDSDNHESLKANGDAEDRVIEHIVEVVIIYHNGYDDV